MQQVWKHKRSNGLEKFKNYQYDEYEKIEFAINNIDSTVMKKKMFNKIDFIFKYTDSTANGKLALPVFFNESIYKNFGQNVPVKKQKREIVAQKTSGFQYNQIIVLTAKNLYKDINVYDNTLNYFNIGFPSPVSTEGFSNYDYNLVGQREILGEVCYFIKYFPKISDILAFVGDLYISKENFAVVKARLKTSKKININFVNGITTELIFDNSDSDTFLPLKKYHRN